MTGFQTTIPDEVVAWLENHPQVESVDTFHEKRLPFRGEEVFLGIIRGRVRGELAFTDGDSEGKAQLLRTPDTLPSRKASPAVTK